MALDDNTTPHDGSALSVADAVSLLAAKEEAEEAVEPEMSEDTEAEAAEDAELTEEEDAEADDSEEDEADAESEDDEDEESEPDVIDIDGEKMTLSEVRELKAMKDSLEATRRNFEADYTRSKQRLAQSERELKAEVENRVAELNQAAEVMMMFMPKEPDENLFQDDPFGYQEQKMQWEKAQRAVATARQQQMSLIEQQRQAQIEDAVSYFTSGEFDPAWKDGDSFKKALDNLTEYGLSEGFTQEELQGVTDKRILKTLEKARRYDALQKQKPKAVETVREKPKVMKPSSGNKAKTTKTRAADEARNKFMKTGSIDDAVSFLKRVGG